MQKKKKRKKKFLKEIKSGTLVNTQQMRKRNSPIADTGKVLMIRRENQTTHSIPYDAFELWFWRRPLRVPCTTRSSQSILKEISPEYSLEGLMLKLKLQYYGHLMQ